MNKKQLVTLYYERSADESRFNALKYMLPHAVAVREQVDT